MSQKYKVNQACKRLFEISVLICLALGSYAQAEVKLPNVIILYADDMGIQNSKSKIPAPRLDQLAKEGMRFTDGHSSSGILVVEMFFGIIRLGRKFSP